MLKPHHAGRNSSNDHWGLTYQRFTLMAPAMRANHARGRAGLINEHQRFEVEPSLRGLPDRTRYRDVEPLLFAGVDCSFLNAA